MIKIKIVIHHNPILLSKFNDQKDFDITIRCKTSEYKLQIAFLYLESEYFEQLESEGTKLIQLHNLNQASLQKTLKLLYGAEIQIKTIKQLQKLYETVTFLKIPLAKQLIKEQLLKQLPLIQSIQLIQFLYQNNLLINQLQKTLVQTDLQILRDPKYSIELNKLSNKVLNVILLDYLKKTIQTDPDVIKQTVNEVLGDYLHASKRKAEEYFEEYNIQILQDIWYELHPKPVDPRTLNPPSEILMLYQRTIRNLKQRVHQLQRQASQKQQKIKRLTQKNEQMKKRSKAFELQTSTKSMQNSSMYQSSIFQTQTQKYKQQNGSFSNSHGSMYNNQPVSLSSTYQSINSQYNKKISFPEITLSSLFNSKNRKRSE